MDSDIGYKGRMKRIEEIFHNKIAVERMYSDCVFISCMAEAIVNVTEQVVRRSYFIKDRTTLGSFELIRDMANQIMCDMNSIEEVTREWKKEDPMIIDDVITQEDVDLWIKKID